MWDSEDDKYKAYDDFHVYDQEYTRPSRWRTYAILAILLILSAVIGYLCK